MLLEILIHHGRMTYWCFYLKLFIGPVRVLWPSCKKVLDGLSSHLTSTMLHSSLILSCIVAVSCLAPPGDWDRFNFAPSSRVVTPTAVHSSDGQIMNPSGLIGAHGNTTFSSSGSWLALDFGVEVRCSFQVGWMEIEPLLIGWRVNFTEYQFCINGFRSRTIIYRVTHVYPPYILRWFFPPWPYYFLWWHIAASDTSYPRPVGTTFG